MLKSLCLRTMGLKKVCYAADFRTRKMLANGMIMSKLIYVIQVYGCASDYLLQSLQVQQNHAARIVTRLGWGTDTKKLLGQIGWLSVKQLYAYHSLITVFKLLHTGKPGYFKNKFSMNFKYQTRQATNNCFTLNKTPGSEKMRQTFRFNSIYLWNLLPSYLKKVSKLEEFKLRLKCWTIETIAL